MTAGHILITGASSGLGAALARLYAAPGVHLTLWGRNNERLEGVAAQCRSRGAVVETVTLDLHDVHAIESHIDRCDDKRPIDLAIFSAGLGGITPAGRVAEHAQRAFALATTNFTSAAMGASVIAERMVKRKKGQIVLVSSVSESVPLPMAPTYAGSKAGLKMFAQSLQLLVKPHGVSVTLASPGFIDTPMSRQLPMDKPFMITAEKAALIMKRGIARHRRSIAFPWPYALLCRMFTWLPGPIQRVIASRLPSE